MTDPQTPDVAAERPPYLLAGLLGLGGLGVVVLAPPPPTPFTVWNQSVVNEKVYTLSVLTIALVLWLAVRWADQPVSTRRDHHLVLIVYLLALTSTNHLMGVLAAPAVLVYVLLTEPRALLRPRFLVAAALVAAVGLSVNLFIPIRAHFDPYSNQREGTPWPAVQALVAGGQVGHAPAVGNPMV